MTWEWNAPDGVYKNHALSSRIREQAAADALFARWLTPENGYGRRRGASVTITRVMQLPLAGRVTESDRLPSGRAAVNTKTQPVSEWGFKIELTEWEENLTHFDLRNRQQRMLRDQMRLTMDQMTSTALKLTPIRASTTGGTYNDIVIQTDGTFAGSSTTNLTVEHVYAIRDYLRGDLKAPGFRNGKYIGILSTNAARGIKNDPKYEQWLRHTTREPFLTGEMTDVDGVQLFETNHFDALANAVGAGNVVGEAIFFGDDPGFFATVLDPELRVGMTEDLGRFREIGWYGQIEAGLTWELASSARVLYFGSA